MKYVQPIGGAVNAPYIDADPGLGIEGSPVPAAAIEHPQREIEAVITSVGLIPAPGDLTQLAKAIQSGKLYSAAAGGTADVLTGTFTPAVSALVDGMGFYLRAGSANATTTPTFTPNNGTIAAKTIVKGNGLALSAGDIAGAGHWIELQYDQTLDKWVLLNPAKGINAASVKQLQSISASVAANALTCTLNPTSLDFRSSPLTSGTINTRTVGAAISVVVPSTATLGTVSATASRLALLAIDNAGSVELAIINLAGGTNLDETTLISTTAISAAATANNVAYSTTARANVPFRVVGFIDISEAVAGTWASSPTAIQGAGGQSLTALSTLGSGQTWQDVTGSRVFGTTYYNTTGKPILISVTGVGAAIAAVYVGMWINGIEIGIGGTYGQSAFANVTYIVPPGASYKATNDYNANLNKWFELR